MAATDSEDATDAETTEYLQEVAYVVPEADETTCIICLAEFLDAEDLEVHIRQVHKDSIIIAKVCQFCDATYADNDDYARHICEKHLLSVLCCRVCTKCFTEGGRWKKHEKKHESKFKTFGCSQCNAVFTSAMEVEYHEKQQHNNSDDGIILSCMPHLSAILKQNAVAFLQSQDRALSCNVCKYATEDLSLFLDHGNEECTVCVCDKCCRVTNSRKNMIKHVLRKTPCKPVIEDSNMTTCLICKNEIHCRQMLTHLSVCNKYKCYVCSIRFSTIEGLSAHQSKVHPVELEVLKCRFCGREFVGDVALDKHMTRSHSHQFALYKYKCMTCEQIFKHPQLLFAHYFTKHKDLEPYTCTICDKKFRIRKRFTIHIKVVHKSIGVVEFDDQYRVFFAAEKSANPFVPKCVIPEMVPAASAKSNIKIKTQQQINYEAAKRKEELPTETEIDDDDDDVVEENPVKKPKTTRKRKRAEVTDISSSSEEEEAEPLSLIKKRAERKRFQKRYSVGGKNLRQHLSQHRQFTCKVCKKYCYTYQNYQNHVQLHKKENIKCIKCSQTFKSKNKLAEHMTNNHTTSKLIETLKNVRERKLGEAGLNDGFDDRNDQDLTPSERFMKTIKRVKPEKQTVPASIGVASADQSVRKFIESFVPDVGESPNIDTHDKYLEEEPNVTLKHYDSPFYRKNLIKMTKFTPEPVQTSIKLKMPEKYKATSEEKVKLRIKLVQEPVKLSMFKHVEPLTPKIDFEHGLSDYDHYDDGDHNDDFDEKNEDTIPGVAEEVTLEGTDEPLKPNLQAPHKIVIPKLPDGYKKIHIATLQPQAPYFKIITVRNNDNSNEAIVIDTENIKTDKSQKEPVKKKDVISLPDGSKFVTANPLAHLLGGKPIEELVTSTKNKYYKPRTKNFKGLFAEALQNLDNPMPKPKRQQKIKAEDDVNVSTEIASNETIVTMNIESPIVSKKKAAMKRLKKSEMTVGGKMTQPSDIAADVDGEIDNPPANEPGKSLPML